MAAREGGVKIEEVGHHELDVPSSSNNRVFLFQ